MDLRTPLGKVKGLGSAKSGTHHWWLQRVTALALIPLVIWFVLMVIKASISADRFVDMLSSPVNSVALILFICVALYHGVLGFRIIVEDYVHCEKVKILSLIAVKLGLFALSVASVFSILKLAL